MGSVLRRAYVEVLPDTKGFDPALMEKLKRSDPGGKAGKLLGGQLNRALKRLDLDPIDVKANPRQALAAIDETEDKLRRLSRDSATVEVKVATERALAQLNRFKRQLGDVGDDGGEQAALGFAARFSQRLGPLVANLPLSGPAAQLGAGLGAAAAPVLLSSLSAALSAGAGAGVIGAGLLLAAKDEQIASAGALAATRFTAGLQAEAARAFRTPILESLNELQRAGDRVTADLGESFDALRPHIVPLTLDVIQAGEAISGSLNRAARNSGPALEALGDSVVLLGDGVSSFIDSVSSGGPEAADTLRLLAGVTADLLEQTGATLAGLGKLSDFLGGPALGLAKDHYEAAAEAAKKNREETARLAAETREAAFASGALIATEEDVKTAQQTLTAAQKDYNDSLATLSPRLSQAAMLSTGLRKATEALYGAQLQATDANEQYEASWDALSGSIKENGRSLNIHTAAGRSNRDALEAVAAASREMYFADVQAGVGIVDATKKHNARIAALKEEAAKSHLSKTETDKLISTYGAIPKGKTTKLVVDGVSDVVQALKDLYVFQRSLADGIPIASEIAKLKGEKGPAKRYGGYAQGGEYTGVLPGPASSVDNLTGVGPDGRTFGLAGGEFIVNARQAGKHRELLEDLNAGKAGFAAGGYYPVEQRPFRVTTNAGVAKVPSRAEVASKVILAVPNGGRTSDWIVRAARQIEPGIRVLSKDRPGAITLTGNRSYHSMGRAVDFEASYHLAKVWNDRYMARTKELISPWQSLNIHNGQRHSYSPLVYNQHNFAGGNPHDHIAMDDGGMRVLRPGLNVIRNGTGRPEPIAGPAAMASMGNTYNITVNVPPTAHPAEVGRQVVTTIQAYEQSNGSRWRQ